MVILYADTITPSMRRAMDETERRRENSRRARMISIRSMVSMSWCIYRTRMPAPFR